MKLLLDVYTSLIFRLSFALPVSFVYRKYSVRVKRKFFWGSASGSASRTGKDVGQVGRVRQVRRVRQVGQVGQVGQMRAIVGCEYMLGLTKQLFRDIPDYSEKK